MKITEQQPIYEIVTDTATYLRLGPRKWLVLDGTYCDAWYKLDHPRCDLLEKEYAAEVTRLWNEGCQNIDLLPLAV